MITIVGGVYRERCMRPGWGGIYGLAGCATTVTARFGGKAEPHTCVGSETQEVIETRATAEDFKFNGAPVQAGVTFECIHGLANPNIRHGTHVRSILMVSGEKVLRFGMIDRIVVANTDFVIYDPQNADESESFSANGSIVKHPALVLNRHGANSSLPGSRGLHPEEVVIALAKQENANAIAIKIGSPGVLVYDNGKISTVPAYRTECVWKIGSGDIFAVHFTLVWPDNGLSAHDAVSTASIATAFYCECRRLPDQALLAVFKPKVLQLSQRYRDGYTLKVYLAGPSFTLTELWMVGQACRDLKAMGLEVFSSYCGVGLDAAEDVVEKDLEGVRSCDVLLAIGDGLDPGMIFEIGYAQALNKPVVFYAENKSEQDQKMMEGSDCTMVDNYVSAIYQMVWKAVEL